MILRRSRRRPPTPETPDKIELIRVLAARPLTQGQIAAQLNISLQSVRRWGQKYNIPMMDRFEARRFSMEAKHGRR